MTARVFHANLRGSREDKYRWLADHAIDTTDWAALDPGAAFYLFTPQDVRLRAEYDVGWAVTDIFPVNLGSRRPPFAAGLHRPFQQLLEQQAALGPQILPKGLRVLDQGPEIGDRSPRLIQISFDESHGRVLHAC